MIVINLWGVPSSGKSTAAAYLFYRLKDAGINCELISEVSKDMCWDNNVAALKNQLYITGNQSYKLSRLSDKVDVAITDAPLLLQGVYYKLNNLPEPDMMDIILNQLAAEYENYNYLLPIPDFEVSRIGRIHDNSDSEKIHEMILDMLNKFDHKYTCINRSREDYDEIAYNIIMKLRSKDN